MGNGEIGQTYLLKNKDTYYESRLSYFPADIRARYYPGAFRTIPPRHL
jgi:hypothetical protein